MPGAYAHLTLVGLLADSQSLEKVPDFPIEAIKAILKYVQFTDLGAVSPDYPYLKLGSADDNKWADRMHHDKTGDMIKTGIELVRQMQGEARAKTFVWLLGYAAHVGTDVTIHPIVQRKVGPYLGNEKAHRVCELHQDAYIFQRLNLGHVGAAEYLTSGIWRCGATQDSGTLDPAVVTIWDGMFRACYPEAYQAGKPRINEWHRAFRTVVNIAEESAALPAFARHLGVGAGFTYPLVAEIDKKNYIDHLDTPVGKLHYDQIFDRALNNVLMLWSLIAAAVFNGDTAYQKKIGNWDLDTGEDADKKLVFWGA
jgi:hypothetical protein